MFKIIVICLTMTVLGLEMANGASLSKLVKTNEDSQQRLGREIQNHQGQGQQQVHTQQPNQQQTAQNSWASYYPYGYHYNPFMMPHHPNCAHMAFYGSSEEMEGCNMYWSYLDKFNQTGVASHTPAQPQHPTMQPYPQYPYSHGPYYPTYPSFPPHMIPSVPPHTPPQGTITPHGTTTPNPFIIDVRSSADSNK